MINVDLRMVVERDQHFIVQLEDKWMLNDMKANANIKNTKKGVTAVDALITEF